MLSAAERAQGLGMGEMFRRLASDYDRVNRVISLGRDLSWRRLAVATLPREGKLLDIATGTGDMALLAQARSHTVVGLDLCLPMLHRSRSRGSRHLVQGNALTLPFREGSFDALTIGFALRNILSLPRLFRECLRVLRPGGRIALVELTQPPQGWRRPLYRLYLQRLVPRMGGWLAGNRKAYSYLPRSVLVFPSAPELAELMAQAGFRGISWKYLGWGAVALHTGWR